MRTKEEILADLEALRNELSGVNEDVDGQQAALPPQPKDEGGITDDRIQDVDAIKVINKLKLDDFATEDTKMLFGLTKALASQLELKDKESIIDRSGLSDTNKRLLTKMAKAGEGVESLKEEIKTLKAEEQATKKQTPTTGFGGGRSAFGSAWSSGFTSSKTATKNPLNTGEELAKRKLELMGHPVGK